MEVYDAGQGHGRVSGPGRVSGVEETREEGGTPEKMRQDIRQDLRPEPRHEALAAGMGRLFGTRLYK